MRILFSELPDGTEYGQVLCYAKENVPMPLLEAILVSPEDQARLMWPEAGTAGWLEGPLYREGPIESSHPPIGRPIALYGIARKIENSEDPESQKPPPREKGSPCAN